MTFKEYCLWLAGEYRAGRCWSAEWGCEYALGVCAALAGSFGPANPEHRVKLHGLIAKLPDDDSLGYRWPREKYKGGFELRAEWLEIVALTENEDE